VAKDRSLFFKIENLMRQKPLDFVGTFNARELAVFLKRCRLLISPDSGPVHIASALGVPTVVLFGPGEYVRYRPYGNAEKTIVIKKEIECSPCFKNVCRNNKCMKLIAPEEIFEAVKQLLERINV
jgi:ADP-heptose:LPS heptosyltransferase